jgi:hypothetical protein
VTEDERSIYIVQDGLLGTMSRHSTATYKY